MTIKMFGFGESWPGQTRNEEGPQLLQVGPYEELLNVSTKWVLEKVGLPPGGYRLGGYHGGYHLGTPADVC